MTPHLLDVNAVMPVAGTADVSTFAFLNPIFAFLAVFIILFALLMKSKLLGEEAHPWINLFVSFLIAIVFVTFTALRELVLIVVPWFAILLLATFFILLLVGFMGKTDAVIGKGLAWFFIILLIAIFVGAGIKVFAGSLSPYLPGPYYGLNGDPQMLFFFDWLYSPGIAGTGLLMIVTVVVGWVLIKFTGGTK